MTITFCFKRHHWNKSLSSVIRLLLPSFLFPHVFYSALFSLLKIFPFFSPFSLPSIKLANSVEMPSFDFLIPISQWWPRLLYFNLTFSEYTGTGSAPWFSNWITHCWDWICKEVKINKSCFITSTMYFKLPSSYCHAVPRLHVWASLISPVLFPLVIWQTCKTFPK